MKIGFIGTGAISTALVTGLCTAAEKVFQEIWLSPRSRENAAALKSRFSEVWVGSSNQNVVDNCDVVFLAFLPKDIEEIIGALIFRRDQLVINLLSGTRNKRVAHLLSINCTVCRAVPLPCNAEHIGPIVIYPNDSRAGIIFNQLGTVVRVENESDLEHLSVITALMAPFFQMLGSITDWAAGAGINQKQAADYTASMYEALSRLALKSPAGDMHQLADESMTPGGLNELARGIINASNGYDNIVEALNAVSKKVSGAEGREMPHGNQESAAACRSS